MNVRHEVTDLVDGQHHAVWTPPRMSGDLSHRRSIASLDDVRASDVPIGTSAAWAEVIRRATRVAATEVTTCLQGESGTGKEVIARFIHQRSPRRRGPFIAINCAALPEQLLESELFGFERGAFTGAQQPKPGQIELAAGGVLFLDEVTEMTPTAQAKFLRVLQEREFLRLGGTRPVRVNVRVIAATNRNLHEAVASGEFRAVPSLVYSITLPGSVGARNDVPCISGTLTRSLPPAVRPTISRLRAGARDCIPPDRLPEIDADGMPERVDQRGRDLVDVELRIDVAPRASVLRPESNEDVVGRRGRHRSRPRLADRVVGADGKRVRAGFQGAGSRGSRARVPPWSCRCSAARIRNRSARCRTSSHSRRC